MSPTSSSRARSSLLRGVRLAGLESTATKYLLGLESFIGSQFPSLSVRSDPSAFSKLSAKASGRIARQFAVARVKDPARRAQGFEPLSGEVDYELRVLRNETRASGVVYDGRLAQDILLRAGTLAPSRTEAVIVLTDRLVATFSDDDLRHHLRTVVFGFPNMISVPGIVEAPAKPREYYLMKQELEMRGGSSIDLEKLKSSLRGRFIDHDGAEIPHVLNGLALQAVLFHLTLDPFCDNRRCRFFNAHWQEELIASQVKSQRVCAQHSRLLKTLSKRPEVAW